MTNDTKAPNLEELRQYFAAEWAEFYRAGNPGDGYREEECMDEVRQLLACAEFWRDNALKIAGNKHALEHEVAQYKDTIVEMREEHESRQRRAAATVMRVESDERGLRLHIAALETVLLHAVDDLDQASPPAGSTWADVLELLKPMAAKVRHGF